MEILEPKYDLEQHGRSSVYPTRCLHCCRAVLRHYADAALRPAQSRAHVRAGRGNAVEPRPAAARAIPVATPAKKVQDWHQIGLASWYGREFQGKETADGESFNMYDLTCAHRSLPLGTWVKVTNLHTRKWIVVRVNDRGPVPDTRIADLSSEAAYMLGMRARGVTRVRLDVIDPKAAVEIARLDRIRMAREAAEQSSIETGN